MATIRWEVPLARYFEACSLVAEAARLTEEGANDRLAEVREAILRFPGYPHSRTPDDLVVLVPADAKVFITPTPTQEPT